MIVRFYLIIICVFISVVGFAQSRPISPGGVSLEDYETIVKVNPVFFWSYNPDAAGYFLKIEEEDEEDKFNIVYLTDEKGPIIDTSFIPPPHILSNKGFYRWSVKTISKDWSAESEYKYFFIELKTSYSERLRNSNEDFETDIKPGEESFYSGTAYDEIFLLLEYEKEIKKNISAYYEYKSDKIYVPFIEIFKTMGFSPRVVKRKKRINCYYFNYSEFQLDFEKLFFKLNKTEIKFENKDFIETPTDFFISVETLNKFFEIRFNVDFGDMKLIVKSDKRLPVLEAKLKERYYRLALGKGGYSDTGLDNLFMRDRSWINGGILDYNINVSHNENSSPSYLYNFALGSEAFGGDLYASVRGAALTNNIKTSEYIYKWRYVFNKNDYITHVNLGHIYHNGLAPNYIQGIQISNEPIHPRRGFALQPFTGITNPGWNVELFINNQFIDYIKADESGRYSIEAPLFYGSSYAELRFVSPTGEYLTEQIFFQIPYLLIPPGEVEYNLLAGKTNYHNENAAAANVSIGIADWITNSVGIEYLENNLSDKAHFYNSLYLKFHANYLANLIAAPDVYYKAIMSGYYYSSANWNFQFANYNKNPIYNYANKKNEVIGSFFIPFEAEGYRFNFGFNGSYARANLLDRWDLRSTIGGSFGFVQPSVGYNGNFVSGDIYTYKRNYLNFGSQIYLSGINIFSAIGARTFGAKIFYGVEGKNFEAVQLSYLNTIFKNGRLHLTYQQNFTSNYSQALLQLTYDFSPFRYTAFAGNNFVSQSLQGSAIYESYGKRFYFSPRQQIGKSSAVFNFFIDDNGNGQPDRGERMIKDAKLYIESQSILTSDLNGQARIFELNPYMDYSVSIDQTKIKNPLITSSLKTFAFTTDPNRVKIVNIPFYFTAEIEGDVVLREGSSETHIPGIKLKLQEVNGNYSEEFNTFSDGSFYFLGLPPGNYKLYVDETHLKLLECQKEGSEKLFTLEKGAENARLKFRFVLLKSGGMNK